MTKQRASFSSSSAAKWHQLGVMLLNLVVTRTKYTRSKVLWIIFLELNILGPSLTNLSPLRISPLLSRLLTSTVFPLSFILKPLLVYLQTCFFVWFESSPLNSPFIWFFFSPYVSSEPLETGFVHTPSAPLVLKTCLLLLLLGGQNPTCW